MFSKDRTLRRPSRTRKDNNETGRRKMIFEIGLDGRVSHTRTKRWVLVEMAMDLRNP